MKSDRLEWLKRARQLRVAGVELEIPEDDWKDSGLRRDSGLIIRQRDGPVGNSALAMRCGAAYSVSLSVVVNMPNFALTAFDLELPWKATPIFIEPPSGQAPYKLPNGDQYPQDVVINHFANPQRLLRRGQVIEGLLLAWSFESIPADYAHGSEIPASLIIYDQFAESYKQSIILWAQRDWLAMPRRRASTRKPLFAEEADAAQIG